LQTELEVEGDGALPKEVEGGLYRVAQEALNNALKHAQAEHVWVRLRQTADSLELEIEDDGVGFDPAVARGQGGFGLQGMEERATSLGGQLVVRSAPGQGSRLHLRLALQEAEVST
jgi:signal transduction histidine kinase